MSKKISITITLDNPGPDALRTLVRRIETAVASDARLTWPWKIDVAEVSES